MEYKNLLILTFITKKFHNRHHTDEGIISAYNPINGWMSSKSFKLAVSEPIGPISVSDGTLITDMNTQRNFTIKLERCVLSIICTVGVY